MASEHDAVLKTQQRAFKELPRNMATQLISSNLSVLGSVALKFIDSLSVTEAGILTSGHLSVAAVALFGEDIPVRVSATLGSFLSARSSIQVNDQLSVCG